MRKKILICLAFIFSIYIALPQTTGKDAFSRTEKEASILSSAVNYTDVTVAAMRNNIVIEDSNNVAYLPNALFIKLNKYVAINEATNKALYLCQLAGLSPRIAQAMGDGGVPSSFAEKQKSSTQNYDFSKTLNAEQNLARLIKIYYTSDTPPWLAVKKIKDVSRKYFDKDFTEYIEPVFAFKSTAPPNDPHITEQKGYLNSIKALEGWEVYKGDTNILIGIVDAGVDMFHEDLAPNIAVNNGESGTDSKGKDKKTNGVDDDNNGVIDDYWGANLTAQLDSTPHGNTKGSNHGTAVAGLAAAKTNNGLGVAGMGYNSRFVPVKTSKKEGGFILQGYEGITYCARRGCKVINCSWGGNNFSQALQDVINSVYHGYGVAIVAAGGNDVKYGAIYPGGYDNVTCVGALDLDDKLTTTWGEHLDFSSVTGFTTGNDNSYNSAGAYTSFATPVVSGLMALVMGKFPKLTVEQASMHIRQTCDNIDAANQAKERLVGFGKINVLRALSDDPFYRPGIVIDSVWTTDEFDKPKEKFSVGDKGRIYLRVKNILGSVSGIRISPTTYLNDDKNVIKITSSDIYLPLLEQGQVVSNLKPVEFDVLKDDLDETKLRFDISANNGIFKDYSYKKLFLFAITTDYITPKIKFSLSNKGNVGYADYPNNQLGLGIEYDEVQQLYEGGIIVATDTNHVLSNVRSAVANQQSNDFELVSKPAVGNDSTLTISDNFADSTKKLGLTYSIKVKKDVAEPNAFGIQFELTNNSNKIIDSLKSALFLDWDLNSAGDMQNIKQSYNSNSNIPIYALIDDGSLHVSQGILGKVASPIFYPLNNETDINIYDNFSQLEKYNSVSNGKIKQGVQNADVSLVMGKFITRLMPQQKDTMLVIFGFGNNQAKAESVMKNFAGLRSVSVYDEKQNSNFEMKVIKNHDLVKIELNEMPANPDIIVVYNAIGEKVLEIKLNESKVYSFSTNGLPQGKYYVRYLGLEKIKTKSLELVR